MPDVSWIRAGSQRVDRRLAVGVLGISTLLTAITGYLTLFSRMQEYDDEGYLLVSVQQFLAGGGLYDRVYSQYGPFYYELMAGLFSIPGLTLGAAGVRLATLAFWVGAGLLAALVGARIAGSVLVGLCLQLLVFLVLIPVVNEPLHPGTLTSLLLLAMVGIATLVPAGRMAVTMCAIGALAGAVLMTKINVGVFTVAALGVSAAVGFPALRRRRGLAALVGLLAVALPTALMAGQIGHPWVRAYALVMTLAVVATLLATRSLVPDPLRHAQELLWAAAGGAVVCLLAIVGALASGSTPAGLLAGIVTEPLGHPRAFSVPLHVPTSIVVIAILSTALAALHAGSARGRAFLVRHAGFEGWIRILAGLGIWFAATAATSADARFLAASALIWIAVAPPTSRGAGTVGPFLRLFVCSLALFQGLHAYPVAGSQVAFSALLMLPVGAICLVDGLGVLGANLRVVARPRIPGLIVTLVPLALACAALVCIVLSPATATYAAGRPLSGRGAGGIRLPAAQAVTDSEVVDTLRRRCATYYSMPGLNSFYELSGETPPTPLNATAWMYLFDSRRQAEIVSRLEQTPGLCILRNQAMIDFWRVGRPLPEGPLANYIQTRFLRVEVHGDYEILTRGGA